MKIYFSYRPIYSLYRLALLCFSPLAVALQVRDVMWYDMIMWILMFCCLLLFAHFTSSHLHIINRIKFMRIWRAVRGEGSELGILARTQSTPLQIRTGIVVSAEKGWRRDAGKLPMNRGKSAVYIYTPLILLTGLITDCSPLVLIRLIIWTCSSRTLLIKHHVKLIPGK